MASFIQFQFRRGPAADWTNANPILADGEMGIEKDTGLFKIGNGINPWAGGTGPQGPTGPLGYGGLQGLAAAGATGPAADNVVLNAYIHHATVDSVTFDFYGVAATKTATIAISIYGNSTAYRVTPDYSHFTVGSSSFPTPQIFFNNNSNSPFQIKFITANTISSSPNIGKLFNLPLTLDTSPAGGVVGSGYSTIITAVMNVPVMDLLDLPSVTPPTPIIAQSSPTVTISGNQYYTTGTQISIDGPSTYFINIFNIKNIYGSDTFTFMNISGTPYTTDALYYGSDQNNTFPSSIAYDTYHYNDLISYTFTDVNFSQVNGSCNYIPQNVSATLTNALGETNVVNIMTPELPLAYVNPTPDEVNILLKSNTISTISSIKRCQWTSSYEPIFSNLSVANIIIPTENLTIVNQYDAVYFPIDGNIYANKFSTPDNFSFPSGFTMPDNGSSTDLYTNYLILQITTPNDVLKYFNLELVKRTSSGFVTDGTETGVSGVSVFWTTNTTSPTSGWYDATDQLINNNSTPENNNTFWQFGLNANTYKVDSGESGIIYLVISFTGYIGLSNINIT